MPESNANLFKQLTLSKAAGSSDRDGLIAELVNVDGPNGWIGACRAAVKAGDEAWLRECTGTGTSLPWFMERLHKREMNPRDESDPGAKSEPLFTRLSIAQSIADAALSAILLRRTSRNVKDDSQIENLLLTVYRATVRWQPAAKIPLIPDPKTMNEMRRCLASEGTHDHRAILTAVLQELHPEWEVAPISELVSYFLDEMSDHWEGPVSINVPLVRWNKTGFVAQLDVEKRHSGVNAFYRDPFTAAFLQYNEGFKEALESAWSYVKTEFDVDGCEVRWRLRGVNQYEEEKNIPNLVTGSSVGAGAAVALAALFTNDRKFVGSKWAITGTVTDEGLIGTVNGHGSNLNDNYREKLHAVASKHLKLIVPGEDWQHVKDDPSSGSISVLKGATTVREATDTIISEERAEKRRVFFKRGFIAAAAAALILAVFASVAAAYAWQQRRVAEVARRDAEKQRDYAQANEKKARASEQLADQNAKLARTNELLAEENERLAKSSERNAMDQKKIAELQRSEAELARNEAQLQRQIADAQKQEAARQSTIAASERQLVLARDAELQGQNAMAEGDSSAAQLFYAKALTLDYRRNTAARFAEAKATATSKLLWSSSENTQVREIGISPDGSIIVTGSQDNSLILIDAKTGTTLRKLQGNEGGVATARFSPDGSYLASAGTAGIYIWDAKSGSQLRKLELKLDEPNNPSADFVSSMAFSPDSRRLVIAVKSQQYGDAVWIWNVDGREKPVQLNLGFINLLNIVVSPGGVLAVSAGDNKIRLWTTNGWKGDPGILDCQESVESLAFCSDDTLAVGTATRIQIWDLTSKKEVDSLTGPSGAFLSLAYSPDRRFLASASQNKTIQLWDIAEGRTISSIPALDSLPIAVAFIGENHLVVESIDGSLRCWRILPEQDFRVLPTQGGVASRLFFSEDGLHLMSSDQRGLITIFDTLTAATLRSFKISGPAAVAYSPNDKQMAVAQSDNGILVFDATNGKGLFVLRGHKAEVTSLAFSADGKYLASGSDDKTVRVWSLATHSEMLVLTGNDDAALAVTFSSDRSLVASGGFDNTVRVWDLKSGKLLNTLQHPGRVISVAFSPDSHRIASSCDGDMTLRVWDLASGKEFLELQYQDVIGRPAGVEFSPDSRTLVWAGGPEGRVRVWDLADGWERPSLLGAKGGLLAIAISHDGKWLASSSTDSNIYLWNLQELQKTFETSADVLLENAKKDTGLDVIGPNVNIFSSQQLDEILGLQRAAKFTLIDAKESSTLGLWRMLHMNESAPDEIRLVCPDAPQTPTLNPFKVNYAGPGPCEDAPALDIAVGNNGFSSTEAEWQKERPAQNGDTIQVRVYVDNGASPNPDRLGESLAKDVRISSDLDSTTGSEHWASVTFSGSNLKTVKSTVRLRTGSHDHLEVKPHSGLVYDSQNNLKRSGLNIGNSIISLAELQPGFSESFWILYTLTVRTGNLSAPTPKSMESLDLSTVSTPPDCPNSPRVATLNSFPLSFEVPIQRCTDAPPLAFKVIGKPTVNNVREWNNGIVANTGDEIFVRIFVSNRASTQIPLEQTLAKNVKVLTFVDTTIGSDHLIRVSFGGDNTNTVSKTLTIRTGPSDALEVVPNSGEAGDGLNGLARNLQIGNNVFQIGDIAPGNGSSIYLVFKVRVVRRQM